MVDLLTSIMRKIFDRYTDDYLGKLSKSIEDKVAKEQFINKALEGEDCNETNRELKVLVDKVCEETNKLDDTCFEENVRNDFDRYLKELGEEDYFDESKKETLFKRYKIFVEGYRNYISKQVTIGEKCILKEIDRVEKGVSNIERGILRFEDIQKNLQEQRGILTELSKNENTPFIDISAICLKVEHYGSKYEFLGNRFKLIRKSDEADLSDENEGNYIFTLYIKNIGEKLIEKISINNFRVRLCAEDESDPQYAYYVCDIMEYDDEPIECNLNLMRASEQNIHFIVRDIRDELNKDKIDLDYEDYDEMYNNDRLFIEFDMELMNGKETVDYHYYIFASRNEGIYEDIVGMYSIDYVGMEMKEK